MRGYYGRAMKATIYHGTRDMRVETATDPEIRDPKDALVRITRAAICGSDLWFYRGITKLDPGAHTGHEFLGIVQEVGDDVRNVRPGDAVGFFGTQNGGQAEVVRVPYADGTLVKMPEAVARDERKRNAAVALCDVMGTGHYGLVAAETKPGSDVVVVGDGAVGLCAVLSAAKEIRAERVIAVGHNLERLEMAKRFGATHTFNSRDENVQQEIVELTQGGAKHVVEAVGNQESLDLAINVARPGGTASFVGVPHNVKTVPLTTMFYKHVALRGGPAPVRAFLPRLIESLAAGRIDPSPVFDLTLPLSRVAEGYAAMDERHAIKVLLDVA